MIFRNTASIHINEYKGHKEMSLQVGASEFLNPEFVNVGDKVKLGQKVAMRTGRFGLPLHSSVSGLVTAVDKKMWHSSGKMVPMIEIQNDFKGTLDESIKSNNVEKLSSEDIINIARDCGIVGLGGSGFPTYVKYQSKTPITTVLINAAECEPFITADYTLIKTKPEKLIRGIKYIMKATGAEKAFIAIKKNKVAAIEVLKQNLANETNISVFELRDVYPAGWEKYIVQKVLKKTYKSLPAEVGAVVNNVQTVIALADAVENNMPLVEKLVTFTGAGINNPQNVYVKIGSKVNEVIENIGGYADGVESAYFVAGGPMTGVGMLFDSLVVNRSLGSIVVLPIENEVETQPCLGCGKCVQICPVFLSPIEIKRALNANDDIKLADLRSEKCIACGLCSYICPSKIELTQATTKSRGIVLSKGRK